MFINGSHIFSKNVFVLPLWEEKITCTAPRMPLLCWFLLIFPHHFKCFFFGILVFRLNPPWYVKPSHKEETDWLDVLMSTLTYTDLSWLKRNSEVISFYHSGKIHLPPKLRLYFTIVSVFRVKLYVGKCLAVSGFYYRCFLLLLQAMSPETEYSWFASSLVFLFGPLNGESTDITDIMSTFSLWN